MELLKITSIYFEEYMVEICYKQKTIDYILIYVNLQN